MKPNSNTRVSAAENGRFVWVSQHVEIIQWFRRSLWLLMQLQDASLRFEEFSSKKS